MSPRFPACAICIVSLTSHKSTLMRILPNLRKRIWNVSSHCPWSYSLSLTEPGFIQVCLNQKSGLWTAVTTGEWEKSTWPVVRKGVLTATLKCRIYWKKWASLNLKIHASSVPKPSWHPCMFASDGTAISMSSMRIRLLSSVSMTLLNITHK